MSLFDAKKLKIGYFSMILLIIFLNKSSCLPIFYAKYVSIYRILHEQCMDFQNLVCQISFTKMMVGSFVILIFHCVLQRCERDARTHVTTNKSNGVWTTDAFSSVLFLVIVLVLVFELHQQGLQPSVASSFMIFLVFLCICIGFY